MFADTLKSLVGSQEDAPVTIARDELVRDPDWQDATFSELEVSAVDLGGKSFQRCVFRKVRLAEANLRRCTFEECEFDGCDLTMAVIEGAAFREVAFLRSKLMGLDWTRVRGVAFVVSFTECNLSHCTFADRNMRETVFRECRAHDAVFAGVDLTRAVFTGTDLRGARFMDTILVEADLSEAVNYEISPQQNRLRKTKFSQEAALALVADLGVVVPH